MAHLGRTTQASAALDEVYRPSIEDELTAVIDLLWLLEAAVLLGDRERASALAERLTPVAPWITSGSEDAVCLGRLLGAAALLAGDRAAARHHYERALAACEAARFRPEIALIRLQFAELLLDGELADPAEVQAHLDFAIEEFRAMKMQLYLERALRAL